MKNINSVQDVLDLFEEQNYVGSYETALAVFNAIKLNMGIIVEGPPGVGKTQLAKTISEGLGLNLLKIQCYDGIDFSRILYEYDYAKQMLIMNTLKETIDKTIQGLSVNEAMKKVNDEINFFGEEFLIERPLLKSIRSDKKTVMLVDELDKAGEELEFLLLEILEEHGITIPEYGPIYCDEDKKPIFILTSNGVRDLSDALKRRTIYLYIDYPTQELEAKIIQSKANVSEEFAIQVAERIANLRKLNLKQKPSISESISWAKSLMANLGENAFNMDRKFTDRELCMILKNKSDIEEAKKRGY